LQSKQELVHGHNILLNNFVLAHHGGKETIKIQILEALRDEPHLDEEHIEVEVKEGEVTLKGRADTAEEKKMAEDIAAKIPGVKKVINHLHLPPGIVYALTALATQITNPEEEKPKEEEGD
jgi:hypothetical protein